jgi:hypothetical protein
MTMTVRWHGAAVSEAVKKGAARGLMLAAEHVLEEATLLRSGVASVDESALRAAVSYDTPYAVRQHEELTYRHDAGRQAKYLEEPLNRERATVDRIIADEIRKVT